MYILSPVSLTRYRIKNPKLVL